MTPQEIKEIRTRLGISQEDFARLLGISLQSIGRWERGKAKPSRLAVKRLKEIATKEKHDS